MSTVYVHPEQSTGERRLVAAFGNATYDTDHGLAPQLDGTEVERHELRIEHPTSGLDRRLVFRLVEPSGSEHPSEWVVVVSTETRHDDGLVVGLEAVARLPVNTLGEAAGRIVARWMQAQLSAGSIPGSMKLPGVEG